MDTTSGSEILTLKKRTYKLLMQDYDTLEKDALDAKGEAYELRRKLALAQRDNTFRESSERCTVPLNDLTDKEPGVTNTVAEEILATQRLPLNLTEPIRVRRKRRRKTKTSCPREGLTKSYGLAILRQLTSLGITD